MARKRGVGTAISEIDLLGRGGDPPPLRLAKSDNKDREDEAAEKREKRAADSPQDAARALGEAGSKDNPEAQVAPQALPGNGDSANGRGGEEAARAAAALLEGEPVRSEPASPEPKAAPANQPEAPKPRRRRKRRDEIDVGVELYLPEDLLFRSRSLVRPQRTGARRSLGAAFVLRAYVRAVDEILEGEIDVQGIDQDADEEMVERVKLALERRLGGGD